MNGHPKRPGLQRAKELLAEIEDELHSYESDVHWETIPQEEVPERLMLAMAEVNAKATLALAHMVWHRFMP